MAEKIDGREKKAKKKRLPWWAATLIVLLSIIIVWLGVSVGVIRFFVGDSLSFKGTLAMVGYGGFEVPEGLRDYILDVDRSYEGLPELLEFSNGRAVTADNYAERRGEMLSLYETYMYGKIPTQGFDLEAVLEESGTALDGAAERRQVRLTVSNESGSCEAMLLVYLPAGVESCPMFVGLNFGGNTGVWIDEKIIPSVSQGEDCSFGGEASAWPVDEIIASGCGVAAMSYLDWAADDTATYRDALLYMFPDENTTAYSAWAFGIMRGIDYLEQLEQVDKTAIATVGHSRLARVSLWAGANDERISLVTASCGGGYLRSPIAGRITSDTTSTHWSTPEYLSYENRDSELPIDVHMLYALAADRRLYISMGQSDLASDPVATYDALQNAKRIWSEIYGAGVIPDGDYYELAVDTPVMSEGVAVHVHSGAHALTARDWQYYIEYMKEYVIE